MRYALMSLALVASSNAFGAVQNAPPIIAPESPSYADLADFALASKVVAHIRIRGVRALTGELAAGTRPGFQRQLVTANVISLIKAPESQPALVKYLVDLPVDSRGRTAKLRKAESLVFALPGRPGELQLISPNSWINWTPAADQTVRAILSEAARADAPPLVRGISSAFHSQGNLPGEGETQIFLSAADNRPASLSIQRQAGQGPQWFVSLGEVVDEGTSQPAPNTLLWYRLACFLPAQIPANLLQDQSEQDALQVRKDYALILKALGSCRRTRTAVAR